MPQLSSVSPLEESKVKEAIDVVLRCFHQFVGGEYEKTGVHEFERYVKSLAERVKNPKYLVLVATSDRKVSGLIEIRNPDHVSLLFVAPECHGQGIAKALWARALENIVQACPGINSVDVNSSRFAVPIYEKLGFRVAGQFTVRNGIGFVPMIYAIDSQQKAQR